MSLNGELLINGSGHTIVAASPHTHHLDHPPVDPTCVSQPPRIISLHYVLTGSCLSIWDSVRGGKHTTERRLLLLDRSLFASKCCFPPVSRHHNVSSSHHRQEIWHEISLWRVSTSVVFVLYRVHFQIDLILIKCLLVRHHNVSSSQAGNLARNLTLESVIQKPLWLC